MKKVWTNPELAELSVQHTNESKDAVGRPVPDQYPGYITCHEKVTGHPVKAYVRDWAELSAFYAEHDDCPPAGFHYEYRPSASA